MSSYTQQQYPCTLSQKQESVNSKHKDTTYLTNQLPNSMKQSSSWKASQSSVRQEISRNVWNLKFRYRIQNSQPIFLSCDG
jgi:hypothetical protein